MRLPLLAILALLCGCLSQQVPTAALTCATYTDSDNRDYCYTNAALANDSLTTCSLIAKPDLRNGCVAALTGDLGLCDNVTDQHWKDSCIYDVAVKTGRIGYCAGIHEPNYKSGCLRDSGPPQADASICDGIGDYNEALWCYATVTRDLLECDRINDTFWQERCVKDINNQMTPTTTTPWYAQETSTSQPQETTTSTLPPQTTQPAPVGIGECERLQSPVEKDWCLSKTGVASKDPTACSLVENQYWREACFRDVAAVTGDPNLCAKMAPGKRRDACYLQVSAATGDKTACALIEDSVFSDLCQKHPDS